MLLCTTTMELHHALQNNHDQKLPQLLSATDYLACSLPLIHGTNMDTVYLFWSRIRGLMVVRFGNQWQTDVF